MNLLEVFERELQPLIQSTDTVHGGFHRCHSWDDAAAEIAKLCDKLGLRRLVLAPRREFEELERGLAHRLGEVRIERDHKDRVLRDYENFDAGIGGADVLVAESASVGLITPGEECAALSLLPETHIVVAPASRIVARLADALLCLQPDGDGPSQSLTFITGPSRTADIEKTLVLPAHGPSRLHVVLIEAS